MSPSLIALIAVAITIWNVFISFWNARVVGLAWGDRSADYGGFMRLVLWSALVQSAVGFSMPILVLEAVIFRAAGVLSDAALRGMFSLWYLMVIVPLLGTGLVITAHSLVQAYRSRNWGDMAVAGYNTLATAHNIYDASSGIGSALKGFTSFADDDEENNGGMLVILVGILVALALAAGALITWGVVSHYQSRTRAELQVAARAGR